MKKLLSFTFCSYRLIDNFRRRTYAASIASRPLIYLLGLLQEDVVEDPRDINVDIVLHGLENVHVGLHGVEELAGLGNLAGLLAVHDHAGQGAGESRL